MRKRGIASPLCLLYCFTVPSREEQDYYRHYDILLSVYALDNRESNDQQELTRFASVSNFAIPTDKAIPTWAR